MVSMAAFADELLKIASKAEEALELGRKAFDYSRQNIHRLKPAVKPVAIGGGSITAYELGKGEIDKYRLGRQVHEQMQARQGE